MVELDNLKGTLYLEELTPNGKFYIEDDNLVKAACQWAANNGFLNVMPPIMKKK